MGRIRPIGEGNNGTSSLGKIKTKNVSHLWIVTAISFTIQNL